MNRNNLSIISLLATAVCSASISFAAQSRPVRLTVQPNTASPIVMQALPNSTCVLHAKGADKSAPSLKLFADQQGTVRFHATPSAESDQTAQLELDCTAQGVSATFPLELRPSSSPTLEMPAPATDAFATAGFTKIRPALTQAEVSRLTASDLAMRGYPARPDQAQTPKAYDTWLRAVTKPSKFVPAVQTARAGVTHKRDPITAGTATSSNWSGYELRGPAGSYVAVQGNWNVPTVSYEANQHVYSAYWVGLDGDGTSDLVQAGTEQEITNINFLFFNFTFTSYYAWTEFLPQQPTEQVVSNFTVNPGDEMSVSVSMGGNFILPYLSGPDGIFLIENVTRGEYTAISTPRGSTTVGGSEAEWIMERPTVGGSLPDLANYHLAFMWNASALSAKTYNWVNYNSAANEAIFMYNNNDLLSGVYYLTPSEMFFVWYAFH